MNKIIELYSNRRNKCCIFNISVKKKKERIVPINYNNSICIIE